MSQDPNALRSLMWRVGVGSPRTALVREQVGRVAAALDEAKVAARAAQALGLPGLYRSPTCWGGAAPRPSETRYPRVEWARRCQAASFEIAVALGRPALPFVLENAFGPLAALHGLAFRALLRLAAAGGLEASTLEDVMNGVAALDADASEEALHGLGRVRPRAPHLRSLVDGLERVARRARSARKRLVTIDPLARLDPERARRFLPDLRALLRRGGEHALDAALLVRALDPRDKEAREVLRRFAREHPDPRVREALEGRLRPPRPVPGGQA